MAETEWKQASMDDRSFVLIFNSAISSHLWGMQLLALDHHHDYQRPFQLAKRLYKLALGIIDGSQSSNNTAAIEGVHKICIPAIFNNLSHICKTLEGYNSYEAYRYDTFLLKAVYWWIESCSSNTNTNPNTNTASTDTSTTGTRTAASIINISSNDDSNYYDDGGNDADIFDAFLENVFYLIGVPQTFVPAPAA